MNNKTRSFPSPDFSGFGFFSYFFLLSTLLLLNLRLLLSGPLYEEFPPVLRSLPERSSVPLLFSITYDPALLNIYITQPFLFFPFYQVRFCDLCQTYVQEYENHKRIVSYQFLNVCHRYQVIDRQSFSITINYLFPTNPSKGN